MVLRKSKQRLEDRAFLNMAREFAHLSNCVFFKVGAAIVLDGRPISMGRNGSTIGHINCCEKFLLTDSREEHHKWSHDHEVHAEMNSVLFAAKNGIKTEGATLYCTHQPCHNCLKHVLQAGIKRIVWELPYDKANYTDETFDMIKAARATIERF